MRRGRNREKHGHSMFTSVYNNSNSDIHEKLKNKTTKDQG